MQLTEENESNLRVAAPDTHAVSVRLASEPWEIKAIASLRYEIYVEERGWTSSHVDPQRRTLHDPLDPSSNIFGAFRGREAVGTIRTHYHGRSDFGFYRALYGLDSLLDLYPGRVALTTMFAVRANLRVGRLPVQLATEAFRIGLEAGIRYALIDCDGKMLAFYSKLGFRIHKQQILHPDYGPGICMIINLDEMKSRFDRLSAKRSAKHSGAINESTKSVFE